MTYRLVFIFMLLKTTQHEWQFTIEMQINDTRREYVHFLQEKILRNLYLRQDNMLESNLKTVALFWINLKQTICRIQNVNQITPLVLKCILTSSYMDLIDQAVIDKVSGYLYG